MNIYSIAERVVVWIGKEEEDTFLAIKMLKDTKSQGFSAEYF
jgi:hypothetical protein